MAEAIKEALPPIRRLFNIHQAAAYLGVSVAFMYKLSEARRVPVTRIGRALRFDPAALDKFIARKTTAAR